MTIIAVAANVRFPPIADIRRRWHFRFMAAAFVDLIDRALISAESANDNATEDERSNYQILLSELRDLRSKAISEGLPRQSRGEISTGTGLGLTKAVGEWCSDPQVMTDLYALEDHFRSIY